MTTIDTREALALQVVAAIHTGSIDELRGLLETHPELAASRLGDEEPGGMSRTLLHVATDWPGHFPRVAQSIAVLVTAGADVNAPFRGRHRETALHWAASSDDVAAVEALLDAGADIDADGGVIAGGTPLGDATAFAQWDTAHLLVSRGARANAFDLAALGMTDELLERLDGTPASSDDDLQHAFWSACHGGRLETAQALARRGADLDWVPGWEDATPLDIAAREGAHQVVEWLHSLSARTFDELDQPD